MLNFIFIFPIFIMMMTIQLLDITSSCLFSKEKQQPERLFFNCHPAWCAIPYLTTIQQLLSDYVATGQLPWLQL